MQHEIPDKKKSFVELLTNLAQADEIMADPELDLAAMIGETKDKVDALYAVLQRMEATAEYLEGMAKPLINKAKALKANHARLSDYIVHTMESANVDRFPGNAYKVALVRASIPALKITEEPNAETYTKWEGYVQLKRQYVWDNARIKEALATNALPGEFPGKLEYSYRAKFSPNIPEALEKKGKK
jgi:Siphovirus Gp157